MIHIKNFIHVDEPNSPQQDKSSTDDDDLGKELIDILDSVKCD